MFAWPKPSLAMACLTAVLAASDIPGIWLDVPFVKQEKDGCGAASIAMVMQFWRQKAGQAVGGRRRRGPHSEDAVLQPGTRHLCLRPGALFPAERLPHFCLRRASGLDLKQHLEKGRPLIVALKPGGGAPLHYVVVTGLDWDQKIVIVNDPPSASCSSRTKSSFEREWSSAGKWTLLALPQS